MYAKIIPISLVPSVIRRFLRHSLYAHDIGSIRDKLSRMPCKVVDDKYPMLKDAIVEYMARSHRVSVEKTTFTFLYYTFLTHRVNAVQLTGNTSPYIRSKDSG